MNGSYLMLCFHLGDMASPGLLLIARGAFLSGGNFKSNRNKRLNNNFLLNGRLIELRVNHH